MGVIVFGVQMSLMVILGLLDNAISDQAKNYFNAGSMALTIGPLMAWMLYRQRVAARLADVASAPMSRGHNSPHHRVRMGIVGSLGVLAALVALSLWGYIAASSRAANDSELVNLAGQQRLLTQKIARYAAASTTDRDAIDSVAAVSVRIEREADSLNVLLSLLHESKIPYVADAVSTSLKTTSARDALLATVHDLQTTGAGTPDRARQSRTVQDAADRLLPLAQRLDRSLQLYRDALLSGTRQAAFVVAGSLIAVILLIALLVVEPIVRLLGRQHAAVAARGVEFERLAMVAQRTSNAVIMTDASRRITWVNDGFVRITGYSKAEAIGQNPGELLQCAQTDPATVHAMREAMERGDSIRCEVLNRTKDGRDYWIDLTIEPLREHGRLTGFLAIENDITDLVRERDAHQAQSRRLDLIVQSADLGTWEWELGSGHVERNAQWATMLGYEPGEVDGRIETWDHLTHPDDIATVREVMNAHLEGQSPEYRCEQRLRRRDGTWCWVLAAGRVIERDAVGLALRAVGVHMDISQARLAKAELDDARLRAEAALREITALRSALDEHSILSVSDRNGRIIDVNTGFIRISGYTADELIGRDHQSLNSGVHSREFWANVWSTISSGHAWRGEVCNRHADGTLYWVDSTIVPYIGADGAIEKYVSIRFDITAQKQAELELQRTTDLLEEAQAVARFGSWSFDLRSGAIQWSREVYRLYGRNESDGPPGFEGMLSDFAPDDSARLSKAVQRTMSSGEPYSLVLRTASGANGVRIVRAECRVRRDPDGLVVGLLGTIMDVTAEIEREEALRQAQSHAEAANRSKSEFLANMSHEIRTPLTAILGYTDLLREDAASSDASAEHLRAIETIRRAGGHLLNVINDILDISKIEAGRMIIERVETDLPRVLFDVDSLMRARSAEKGVALRTTLTSAIPSTILTDPTRLRQILMNLVGNAAKFTDRGRIEIRVGVTDSSTGSILRVAVDDTGPGMTREQAAQLFQPFTQADASVTRRHGGTGLGLTICRRLGQLLGGDVTLTRTSPGEGSCFEVTIPLEPAPGSRPVRVLAVCTDDAAPPTSDVPTLLAGRILLAEDGEDNQRLISFHLRRAGAEVVIAENGRIALDMITAATAGGSPFLLLVSDMQMPEMDGYTLARMLRARGHSLPIIALTAHAMTDDRQKCIDAGCDDYASKPIDKIALLMTCARWLNYERAPHERTDIFPVATSASPAAPVSIAAPAVAVPDALFSEMHDDPDFHELIGNFVRALPRRIQHFEQNRASNDRAALTRHAHQLKGAAGGYGYPSISDAARDVEQGAARGAPATEMDEVLAILVARCRAAVRALALPDDVVSTTGVL